MSPRRVLVVDDHVDNLGSLCALLRLWGYEVNGARTAEQALALVLARRPRMVVMDLALPNGDALALIRNIKTEANNIVIIAFSGWRHLETAARAAGAGAFVLKPDLDSLESLLAYRRRPAAERAPVATNKNRR